MSKDIKDFHRISEEALADLAILQGRFKDWYFKPISEYRGKGILERIYVQNKDNEQTKGSKT